jgi:hypothetical protein
MQGLEGENLIKNTENIQPDNGNEEGRFDKKKERKTENPEIDEINDDINELEKQLIALDAEEIPLYEKSKKKEKIQEQIDLLKDKKKNIPKNDQNKNSNEEMKEKKGGDLSSDDFGPSSIISLPILAPVNMVLKLFNFGLNKTGDVFIYAIENLPNFLKKTIDFIKSPDVLALFKELTDKALDAALFIFEKALTLAIAPLKPSTYTYLFNEIKKDISGNSNISNSFNTMKGSFIGIASNIAKIATFGGYKPSGKSKDELLQKKDNNKESEDDLKEKAENELPDVPKLETEKPQPPEKGKPEKEKPHENEKPNGPDSLLPNMFGDPNKPGGGGMFAKNKTPDDSNDNKFQSKISNRATEEALVQ